MAKARAESRYSAIGLINLDEEANRSAQCEKSARWVRSGGGWNRLTVRILRHFQRKQEATDRLNLRGNGASPRPYL